MIRYRLVRVGRMSVSGVSKIVLHLLFALITGMAEAFIRKRQGARTGHAVDRPE